jgi:sugar-specific transcriptional regulator TrmB
LSQAKKETLISHNLLFFLYFKIKKEVDKLSLERIFKALVNLGLSETDARIYIFLALKGPKKPRKIVDNLKISKQQIVRSLRNLQDKGIIISHPDSQRGFSALPFDKALKLLIKTEKEQTKVMQETLLSTWKTMIEKNSN